VTIKSLILFLLCVCANLICIAQFAGNNEEELLLQQMHKMKFINANAFCILNDSTLGSFYKKLSQLEETKQGKVNVVHIGDSHIQAGYFTGILRRMLQRKYGNGGRGVMFPYRIAKSNGPFDYVSATNTTWQHRRNLFADSAFTTGLAGFTIRADSSDATFCLTLRNNEGFNYDYSHLDLFTHENQWLQISVTDSTANIAAHYDGINSTKNCHRYNFDTLINSACIRLHTSDRAFPISVSGINTYNDSAGVICHTIGVNGAQYKHINNQPLFFEHLTQLNADIIILSFGTNEAYTVKNFKTEEFLATVDSTVQLIKKIYPTIPVLISTPAESGIKYRKRKYKVHPNMAKVHAALVQYCKEKNIACFDLYEAAGGANSFFQWRKMKMMDANAIHFTRKAYEMQAIMLWQSMFKKPMP